MGRRLSFAAVVCALLLLLVPVFAQPVPTDNDHGDPAVREIVIEGAIGPATSRYVGKELEAAAEAKAPAIILRLDTPGGLDGAMREIVQAVLASPVPVIAWVGPSGARAASAGTYILYASHIAAMAPATNLGAATPVTMGGSAPARDPEPKDNEPKDGNDKAGSEREPASDNETAKRRKLVNDAVAYIRGLAAQHGRNADWAERAVREGVSLSAQQALDKNVIEHIAGNRKALLTAVDGTTVQTQAGDVTLATQGRQIEVQEPGWRTQLLSIITQPTVAYLLFLIGIYGLILEGLAPGSTVPGVIGAISLLCALFAFQLLPVNYAGLALIVLGIGLMVAEAFAPSFGMLGLGGMVGFVFGSIMLMDTDVPGYEIPMGLIAGIAVAAALLLMLILAFFLRSRRARVHTGHEGLIGSHCSALADFEREGRVLLQGESWLAETSAPVRRDQALTVTAAKGLKVYVRPVSEDAGDAADASTPDRP